MKPAAQVPSLPGERAAARGDARVGRYWNGTARTSEESEASATAMQAKSLAELVQMAGLLEFPTIKR
jgi:hypothetical protein